LGEGGIGLLNLITTATPPTDDPPFPIITIPPPYTNGRISTITVSSLRNIAAWNDEGIVIAINESETIQTGTFFIDFSESIPELAQPLLTRFENGIGTLVDREIIQVSDGELRLFFSGIYFLPGMYTENGVPLTYMWLNGGEFNYSQNEVIYLLADGTLFTGLSGAKPVPSWAWYGVVIDGIPFNPAQMRFTFDDRGIMREGYSGYYNGYFFLNGASRTGFFWLDQFGVAAYFNAENGDHRQQSGTVTRTIDTGLANTIRNYLIHWAGPAYSISDFTVGASATFHFSNGGLTLVTA